MKYNLMLLLAWALVVGGCAKDKGNSSGGSVQLQTEKNPEVGMTKEQIVAMYGKTDNI
jgi:hypothetical protein